MRPLGIVRKIDELGRVVIPMEVRKVNKWDAGTPIEMFSTNEGILIRKYDGDKEKGKILKELSVAKDSANKIAVKESIQKAIDFIEQI